MADGFNLCHLEPGNSGWNRYVFRPTGVLTTVAVSRCHMHKRNVPVCVCLCVCMCREEKTGSSVDCLTVFGNIFFSFGIF